MYLSRYLVLAHKGVSSETFTCPDWYAYAQGCKWLGVSVTDDVPIWWIDRAIAAMSAEHRAQKQLGEQP